MKSISRITFAVCCMFLVSTATFANTEPTDIRSVKSEILKMIQKPQLEIGTEQLVTLQFLINKDNEIIVISIDSNSDYLESYLRIKLNNKSLLSNDLRKNSVYTMPIRFRA